MTAVRFLPRVAQRGFTLIELIMVIVIMGVVGGMVSVFMKGPIDAYISGGRRAALTDTADTTVRRMARDLHRALPNSIRTNVTNTCLEFVPTRTGGRLRAQGSGALVRDGNTSVSSFNMLGDNATFAGALLPADQKIATGDLVVIYNLGPGQTGADVYATSNANYAAVTSVGAVSGNETSININPTVFAPVLADTVRFQVVPVAEQMVSYVCSAGTLYRTASSALTATASCTISGAKIATNVDCAHTSFSISDSGNALNRNALVSMRLTLQDSSATESVTLQHEVHVDNTP
jgi:MSHA biogenesis protein MshO